MSLEVWRGVSAMCECGACVVLSLCSCACARVCTRAERTSEKPMHTSSKDKLNSGISFSTEIWCVVRQQNYVEQRNVVQHSFFASSTCKLSFEECKFTYLDLIYGCGNRKHFRDHGFIWEMNLRGGIGWWAHRKGMAAQCAFQMQVIPLLRRSSTLPWVHGYVSDISAGLVRRFTLWHHHHLQVKGKGDQHRAQPARSSCFLSKNAHEQFPCYRLGTRQQYLNNLLFSQALRSAQTRSKINQTKGNGKQTKFKFKLKKKQWPSGCGHFWQSFCPLDLLQKKKFLGNINKEQPITQSVAPDRLLALFGSVAFTHTSSSNINHHHEVCDLDRCCWHCFCCSMCERRYARICRAARTLECFVLSSVLTQLFLVFRPLSSLCTGCALQPLNTPSKVDSQNQNCPWYNDATCCQRDVSFTRVCACAPLCYDLFLFTALLLETQPEECH